MKSKVNDNLQTSLLFTNALFCFVEVVLSVNNHLKQLKN